MQSVHLVGEDEDDLYSGFNEYNPAFDTEVSQQFVTENIEKTDHIMNWDYSLVMSTFFPGCIIKIIVLIVCVAKFYNSISLLYVLCIIDVGYSY